MRRSPYFFLPALALLAIAIACGDGGSDGDESAVSPTAEATAVATVTPGADETPGSEPTTEVSVVATPAPSPKTTVTAVPGARLAVMPDDVQGFLAQFADVAPTPVNCDYDSEKGLVDCTDAGYDKFQLAPEAPETVVRCAAGIVDEEAVWIRCTTDISIFYYEVSAE